MCHVGAEAYKSLTTAVFTEFAVTQKKEKTFKPNRSVHGFGRAMKMRKQYMTMLALAFAL